MFPLWVGWFETKYKIDVLHDNTSVDVSPNISNISVWNLYTANY